MLTKDEFIEFIVEGPKTVISKSAKSTAETVLPEGFDGFGFNDQETETPSVETISFARNLMEASGFGPAQYLERSEVILGDDPAAKYLSDRVYYWSQTSDRPYQTLLFELDIDGFDLLKTPLFRSLKGQQILEDALSRLVQMSLKGFERGGERRTASVKQGRQTETLCIVSCPDDREETEKQVNLVCFGTVSSDQNSLESFHIREESKYWEPQIRNDHLEKLYKRHFSKLISDKWQDAFISGEERKLARKLLEVCIETQVNERRIQESAVELLEEISKSFGLRRKGGKGGRRLTAFDLPSDHDIGMDPENLEKHGGENPFKGMTLRDEKNRLLGYIIYCLDEKKDAVELRNYLLANNRFHNVLIIYPDGDHAELELWQGKVPLAGKLTKQGAEYQGEGEVVNLLSRFFVVSKAKVKNPAELAQELAYRARYLRRLAIKELNEEDDDGPLRKLYKAFTELLIHDQTKEEFADAFAQTLTYGLLTARWMGSEKITQTEERFTRQTALKYLPTTSNFLGDLFETALSVKLDEQRGRLLWLVDDIANLLDRIDVNYVFGAGDKDSDSVTDPVIHFYEPFLAEYDKKLKSKRGVFFTPRPVVSFIVRSVHEMLQKEFGLDDGLASTDTWGDVQKSFPDLKLPENVKETDPFVCILDPATGTGTFLYECIGLIEKIMKEKWCRERNKESWGDYEIKKLWSDYVKNHLVSRLYGYEFMMASYSIAHLKLTFKLGETGYVLGENERIHIYLTNSLEPTSDIQKKLPGMMSSLANESREVNQLKKNKRFTIVIGNPPYAKSSANRSESAEHLVAKYKELVKEEINVQPLSDDYIKFLSYAFQSSHKNSSIVGMITNRSYINGLIHRGMRKTLLKAYDKILIFDLHGDSNVGEAPPKGKSNENVFDITQGVAISIFISSHVKSINKIKHLDLWGTRAEKYQSLQKGPGSMLELAPKSPYFFFTPKDLTSQAEQEEWVSMTNLFNIYGMGLKSRRDHFLISMSEDELENRFEKIVQAKQMEELRGVLKVKDNAQWSLQKMKNLVIREGVSDCINLINYRPFDKRYIWYHREAIERGDSRWPVMKHVLGGEKSILTSRQSANKDFTSAFVVKGLSEMKAAESSRGSYAFPLNFTQEQLSLTGALTKENINKKLLGSSFSKKSSDEIASYIYSILYSPEYRKRYAEPLRIEFPKIPFSCDEFLANQLIQIGQEIVSLHLMEFDIYTSTAGQEKSNNNYYCNYNYLGTPTPVIEKAQYSDGNIFLDKKKTSGFINISKEIWGFDIGGYQVCRKWLKDRKGRILSPEDIEHYQKIIVAINETIRLQAEIDEVIDEHGGWPGAFVTDRGGAS